MTLPGPSAGAWALGLVVWAAAAAVLGESLRLGVARWVPAWRRDEPIQRLLLDFYLGGAVLSNPVWWLVVLLLSMVFQYTGFSMIQTLFMSIVPEGSMPAATGLAAGLAQFAAMTAPVLVGFIIQISGFEAVVIFVAFVSLLSGLCMLPMTWQRY